MLPFNSIVKYEIQRRASSRYGPTKASVGQALRHRSHDPHRFLIGWSAGSSRLRNSSPRKKYEPCFGEMRSVFLPIHPIPAKLANPFSNTGPVSTYALP